MLYALAYTCMVRGDYATLVLHYGCIEWMCHEPSHQDESTNHMQKHVWRHRMPRSYGPRYGWRPRGGTSTTSNDTARVQYARRIGSSSLGVRCVVLQGQALSFKQTKVNTHTHLGVNAGTIPPESS